MKFDILSIHEKSTVTQLEANAIKSLKNTEIQRFGVRRFENGKTFQTSRLGESNVDRLIADTREWGGPGIAHDYGFAKAHVETRKSCEVGLDSITEFQERSVELAAQFPEFVFSGKCAISNTTTSLTSNYGIDLKTSGGLCDWYLVYQSKGSGNMFDGFISQSAAQPTIQAEIEAHKQYLNVYKNKVQLPPGKMPVLFVEAETPLKKLRESLMIHRYRDGSCLYAGSLGKTIFSPQVTLLDRSYIPDAGLTQFFDGEGSVRASDDLALIQSGRFENLICDLRFGKKFDSATTGNGMRGYNSGVSLAQRKLGFQSGKLPWREVIRDLDRCLVAVIAVGGDSNELGEFSTPVQIGFVFEKGELVGRAPQVTVKASLTDYLGKDLIAVASDSFTPNATSASLISQMDVILN